MSALGRLREWADHRGDIPDSVGYASQSQMAHVMEGGGGGGGYGNGPVPQLAERRSVEISRRRRTDCVEKVYRLAESDYKAMLELEFLFGHPQSKCRVAMGYTDREWRDRRHEMLGWVKGVLWCVENNQ